MAKRRKLSARARKFRTEEEFEKTARVCQYCGMRNSPEREFCPTCGGKINALSAGKLPAVPDNDELLGQLRDEAAVCPFCQKKGTWKKGKCSSCGAGAGNENSLAQEKKQPWETSTAKVFAICYAASLIVVLILMMLLSGAPDMLLSIVVAFALSLCLMFMINGLMGGESEDTLEEKFGKFFEENLLWVPELFGMAFGGLNVFGKIKARSMK